MSVSFDKKDLAVFDLQEFQERMPAIRNRIRPKLEALGEELGPLLMRQFKAEFFAHTAKHMRRTVNPPDETWVAFGPQSRGYKAYVYGAFCIGKAGAQVRVVMKDESPLRAALGKNILKNQSFFEKHAKDWKGLSDYLKRDAQYRPQTITDIGEFIDYAGNRLTTLKSALFDVGFVVDPFSPKLAQEVLKSFEKLYPFYLCGLKEGVRLG